LLVRKILRTKELVALASRKSLRIIEAISVSTENKGLDGKTLYGKDLATVYSVFNELFLTACAAAMMTESDMNRKVRCHSGAVEIFRRKLRDVWLLTLASARENQVVGQLEKRIPAAAKAAIDLGHLRRN
jgi:hypothetical protein